MKRVILNLSEDVVDKTDKEVTRLGLPSRNSYIEQCIRYQLKLPNVFDQEVK